MEIKNFVRKQFDVRAVRVTNENLAEVAAWCKGEIRTTEEPKTSFIYIDVRMPMNERQKKAFAGDWVVEHHNGFKVFQNHGFHNSFEEVLIGRDWEGETEVTPATVHVVSESPAKTTNDPEGLFSPPKDADLS
jgi:hypothetical protein